MGEFHKTNESYVAGSMTLPQEYYVSEEMFAEDALEFWPSTGITWAS